MPTAILRCSCGLEKAVSQDPIMFAPAVAAAILSIHASKEHVTHEIRFFFIETQPALKKELVVRCLVEGCRERWRANGARSEEEWTSLRVFVEPALVPAVALAFHTSHEGHAMSIVYDGEEIVRSPGEHA